VGIDEFRRCSRQNNASSGNIGVASYT